MSTNIAALISLVLNGLAQATSVMQTIQTAHANGTDVSDDQVKQALADAQAANDALQAAIAKG
jgi:hypothetical protein